MAYPLDILFDDRAFIKIAGNIMRGCADQFDAALVRLVIRLGAFEAGQEAVVNVDAAALQLFDHLGGEHLHVPSQHDEVGAGVVENLPDPGFLRGLGIGRDWQVVKRQVAKIGTLIGFARMVGNDAADFHLQFSDTPAVKQVDKAMVALGRQDQYLFARAARMNFPGHAIDIGDRDEIGHESRSFRIVREIERRPHEKQIIFAVIILMRFEYVPRRVKYKAGYFMDNARHIFARKCQNIALLRHGNSLKAVVG